MVAEQAVAEGRRRRAFPCVLRYSDAGKCLRQIAISFLADQQPDDEDRTMADVDVAGEFRMWLGTVIHELVMDAIRTRHGGALEVPTSLQPLDGSVAPMLAAGHADWIGEIDGASIAYELKTEGSFGFNSAVGLKRKMYERDPPAGPRSSAKIQGALNALASDCDVLVVGVVAMEAVSINLAAKVGMSNLDRIVAEWHYERAEWTAWAYDELARARRVLAALTDGVLPPREAVGDEMEPITLKPEQVHSDTGLPKQWQCTYCRHRDVCVAVGDGPVPVALVIGDTRG